MRIALAQINPTVGAVAANTAKIIDAVARGREAGAELVVLPELAVAGYPPKDLLLKPAMLDQCQSAITKIAAACEGVTAIVGYPAVSDRPTGRTLYNAAAVCRDGKLVHRHVKSLLPTYDVFDETRYFEPGPAVDLTEHDGVKLGISVCEDLWNSAEMFSRQLYHDNPIDQLAAAGAQLFINCSASPFVTRKHDFRLQLFKNVAARHHLPLVYVNQVGGNDELVFDGNSCVVDANGNVIAHAKDFEEDLLVVDLVVTGAKPQAASRIEKPRSGMAAVYAALVLGLRDYCRKCGFKSLVVGLSGGIDSAVTAALAAAAVGAANVTGVAMPSRYSSSGSLSDAASLAANLHIQFATIPIEPAHQAMEQMLTPALGELNDITAQNLQARVRGQILMAFSNQQGSMLVTTGNKSEIAVGYCTLYGDMAGGLAVLSDVPKTMVYELARHINAVELPGVIPIDSITKPPSAELRPNQTDQDTLPPYDVLDDIIERYVERHDSVPRIVADTKYDLSTVSRVALLIDRNEYKRKQAAPGLKITGRAFGFGRRMPIAQRFDPSAET
ncbi:MAG: NAD+ synthase [Planctomycetes bacterium]|nr:NAD+ synthase [Planctomycetota bacterium]